MDKSIKRRDIEKKFADLEAQLQSLDAKTPDKESLSQTRAKRKSSGKKGKNSMEQDIKVSNSKSQIRAKAREFIRNFVKNLNSKAEVDLDSFDSESLRKDYIQDNYDSDGSELEGYKPRNLISICTDYDTIISQLDKKYGPLQSFSKCRTSSVKSTDVEAFMAVVVHKAIKDSARGCVICQCDDSWETILLCDSCDFEFHLRCLKPPLVQVPDGKWYCPCCSQKQNSTGIEKKIRLRKQVLEMQEQLRRELSLVDNDLDSKDPQISDEDTDTEEESPFVLSEFNIEDEINGYNHHVPQKSIQDACVFYPSMEEFARPIEFIRKIAPIAQKYGLCRIIPPLEWNPPFSLGSAHNQFSARLQHVSGREISFRIKRHFWLTLHKFLYKSGIPTLTLPRMDSCVLDLYEIYKLVVQNGGYNSLTSSSWISIATNLSLPPLPIVLKTLDMIYQQYLLPFEEYDQRVLYRTGEMSGKRTHEHVETEESYEKHATKKQKTDTDGVHVTEFESRNCTSFDEFSTIGNKEVDKILKTNLFGAKLYKYLDLFQRVETGIMEPSNSNYTQLNHSWTSALSSAIDRAKSRRMFRIHFDSIDYCIEMEPHEAKWAQLIGSSSQSAVIAASSGSCCVCGTSDDAEINFLKCSDCQCTFHAECLPTGIQDKPTFGPDDLYWYCHFCLSVDGIRKSFTEEPPSRVSMYSWDTFSKMADDAKVEYWTQSHTQNCLQSLNAESLLQSFTQAKKQRNDIFIPGESTCIKPINVEFGFPTPIPSITPISANCTPNLGLNHAQMGQSHKSNTNPTKDEPSIPPLLTRVPGMNMGISVSDVDREFWHITKQNQETMMVDCANAIKTTMIGSGFPVNEKLRAHRIEQTTKFGFSDPALPHSGTSEYEDSGWNLNNIVWEPGSLMRFADQDIDCITLPQININMCFSSTDWHTQQHFLYSVHYLHTGDSKVWYSISGDQAEEFDSLIKSQIPTNSKHGKKFLISPQVLLRHGIQVYRTVQEKNQFIITFPKAYHAEINTGLNCSEEISVASPEWIIYGREAERRHIESDNPPLFSFDKLICSLVSNIPRSATSESLQVATYLEDEIEKLIQNQSRLLERAEGYGVVITKDCVIANTIQEKIVELRKMKQQVELDKIILSDENSREDDTEHSTTQSNIRRSARSPRRPFTDPEDMSAILYLVKQRSQAEIGDSKMHNQLRETIREEDPESRCWECVLCKRLCYLIIAVCPLSLLQTQLQSSFGLMQNIDSEKCLVCPEHFAQLDSEPSDSRFALQLSREVELIQRVGLEELNLYMEKTRQHKSIEKEWSKKVAVLIESAEEWLKSKGSVDESALEKSETCLQMSVIRAAYDEGMKMCATSGLLQQLAHFVEEEEQWITNARRVLLRHGGSSSSKSRKTRGMNSPEELKQLILAESQLIPNPEHRERRALRESIAKLVEHCNRMRDCLKAHLVDPPYTSPQDLHSSLKTLRSLKNDTQRAGIILAEMDSLSMQMRAYDWFLQARKILDAIYGSKKRNSQHLDNVDTGVEIQPPDSTCDILEDGATNDSTSKSAEDMQDEVEEGLTITESPSEELEKNGSTTRPRNSRDSFGSNEGSKTEIRSVSIGDVSALLKRAFTVQIATESCVEWAELNELYEEAKNWVDTVTASLKQPETIEELEKLRSQELKLGLRVPESCAPLADRQKRVNDWLFRAELCLNQQSKLEDALELLDQLSDDYWFVSSEEAMVGTMKTQVANCQAWRIQLAQLVLRKPVQRGKKLGKSSEKSKKSKTDIDEEDDGVDGEGEEDATDFMEKDEEYKDKNEIEESQWLSRLESTFCEISASRDWYYPNRRDGVGIAKSSDTLENGQLVEESKDTAKEEKGELVCLCRKPLAKKSQMISCHQCGEKFHPRCLGLKRNQILEHGLFECRDCCDKSGNIYAFSDAKIRKKEAKEKFKSPKSAKSADGSSKIEQNKTAQTRRLKFFTRKPKLSVFQQMVFSAGSLALIPPELCIIEKIILEAEDWCLHAQRVAKSLRDFYQVATHYIQQSKQSKESVNPLQESIQWPVKMEELPLLSQEANTLLEQEYAIEARLDDASDLLTARWLANASYLLARIQLSDPTSKPSLEELHDLVLQLRNKAIRVDKKGTEVVELQNLQQRAKVWCQQTTETIDRIHQPNWSGHPPSELIPWLATQTEQFPVLLRETLELLHAESKASSNKCTESLLETNPHSGSDLSSIAENFNMHIKETPQFQRIQQHVQSLQQKAQPSKLVKNPELVNDPTEYTYAPVLSTSVRTVDVKANSNNLPATLTPTLPSTISARDTFPISQLEHLSRLNPTNPFTMAKEVSYRDASILLGHDNPQSKPTLSPFGQKTHTNQPSFPSGTGQTIVDHLSALQSYHSSEHPRSNQ